ncbi:Formate/nitrite transporter-domain-containing protein [Podospora didyma]|uniref:Formate/nitrite transporter-domain-containing protein n=1 Tax=Podospora didyma TaxID=330526 RepID=A0AAE0P4N5_9PEZI|nr:Formate/nitrite transporter-domain-containing protein [Podospora didyma]
MSNPAAANLMRAGSYTPLETIELVSRAGAKKGHTRPDKVFFSAVSGGCLSSFAAGASLIVTTAPWFQENAPGLIRMVGALIFPLGLVMIILTGAELYNGTCMYTTVAAFHKRLSVPRMLLHWFICFWGNLAGSLFVTICIIGYGGVFDDSPYRDQAIDYVTQKQITPTFLQIFLRGIGANWLVCLACYLGMQGKDLNSKIVGMWWPIFAFVVLGLDHVVANMMFVPLGLWLHVPGLTIEMYIWKGIIPAGLGNMIGGAVFCGAFYYWMLIFQAPQMAVDGIYNESQIADNIKLFGHRDSTDVEHGADMGKGLNTSRESSVMKPE